MIIAVDMVGNSASASFVIDKHVDFISNKPFSNGQIITGSVAFTFDEPVKALLTYNGVENIYTRGEIVASGDYALTVTDAVGNIQTVFWSIVPEKARNYLITVPYGYFVSVERDGQVVSNIIEDNTLMLAENGSYRLHFINETTNWILELVIDNVAPSVHFENTRKSVIISQPNKTDITYTLYYNGVETAFNLKNSVELTKIGSYRLVCTDALGNVAEYNFELNYLSDISIAFICVVFALVVVGIVAIIVFRFKRKIY